MSDATPEDSRSIDRRGLLKLGAAGLGLTAAQGLTPGLVSAADSAPFSEPSNLGLAPAQPFAADPMEVVRIGFVGVGLQGGSHVRNYLGLDGVEVVALCDINQSRLDEVAGWVTADGRPQPKLYGRGDHDFGEHVGHRTRHRFADLLGGGDDSPEG